jgi:hypothetical protein
VTNLWLFRQIGTFLLDTADRLRYFMSGLSSDLAQMPSGAETAERERESVTAESWQGVLTQIVRAGRTTQGKEA